MSKTKQSICVYFLISLSLIILYNFDPAHSQYIYPPSLSREWGGFYCPGCGMLRALHQLLHGNYQAALRLNPLLIVSLPYFLYWIIPCFFEYFYQIHLYTIRYPKQQAMVIVIIYSLYGILRNVTAPESWLVPPG